MPVEEHKELRELVSHTLQAKGVLQKVQAEIRASVFLALEEQDVFKDKNPFINAPLKNYLATTEGLLAISLIKEFLDFFNLEFTSLVFDPETHAGIDYTYEGRQKIIKDLKIDIIDNKVPLLGLVVKLLSSLKQSETNSSNSSSLNKDIPKNEKVCEHNDNITSNGINGTIMKKDDSEDRILITTNTANKDSKIESPDRFNNKKEAFVTSSMSSLGDLPPLARSVSKSTCLVDPHYLVDSNTSIKVDSDLETDSSYPEDLLLPSNLKNSKNSKSETNVSEGSEVEEEISEAASGPTDDNTVDLSVSKGSGKADYLEDLHLPSSHLLD